MRILSIFSLIIYFFIAPKLLHVLCLRYAGLSAAIRNIPPDKLDIVEQNINIWWFWITLWVELGVISLIVYLFSEGEIFKWIALIFWLISFIFFKLFSKFVTKLD